MIQINENNCPKNHACPAIRLCPHGALSQANFHSAPKVDQSKCTGCGRCIKACRVFQMVA